MKKNRVLGIVLLIVVSFVLPITAEDEIFQPVVSFHGSISITADSYFGNYPDDPVVEIPDGLEGEELEEWERIKKEDEDIRKMFSLSNPTVPGITQRVELEFYANPLPDLEMFIKMDRQGMWGGASSVQSLNYSLFIQEAYARYYTNRGMYTVGRFKYNLGPMGLSIGNLATGLEGVMVNTMVKDIWITGVYNRLFMSMYKDYPYVSEFLLDDLWAVRLSKGFGEQLIGMNLILDGFYNEKTLTFDIGGKVLGKSLKGEVGLMYPAHIYHSQVGEGIWPAGVISVNLIENWNNLLAVRLGGISKGFISPYGTKGMTSMESGVKFNPNTGGIDILYQHGLTDDMVLGLNLVYLDYLDKKYQEEIEIRVPLRTCEAKLQKYLSQFSKLSLSIGYLGDMSFDYGKLSLNWEFTF
ncbi:MAG: hypothetical protein KAX49_12100 [Halanaerobiales bacterium]|nr:hypothetical protein [Halanaerobiales bacterium]